MSGSENEYEKLKKENKRIEEDYHDSQMDKLISLIGNKKKLSPNMETQLKNYFNDNPNKPKEILLFMQKLSSENKAVHEKVMDIHKDTINKLFERLNKNNISEKEMDYIYNEIRSLSEKIEDVRKSWKGWVEKVGFSLIGILATLAGGYASAKLAERKKVISDVIEGEFTEINDIRKDN